MIKVLAASEVTGLIQLGEMAKDSIKVSTFYPIVFVPSVDQDHLVFEYGSGREGTRSCSLAKALGHIPRIRCY